MKYHDTHFHLDLMSNPIDIVNQIDDVFSTGVGGVVTDCDGLGIDPGEFATIYLSLPSDQYTATWPDEVRVLAQTLSHNAIKIKIGSNLDSKLPVANSKISIIAPHNRNINHSTNILSSSN